MFGFVCVVGAALVFSDEPSRQLCVDGLQGCAGYVGGL